MVEFNPDGSIKLTKSMQGQKYREEHKLKDEICIRIKKEVINDKSPKKCALHITLSEKIKDSRFIETIYSYFHSSSEVPSKLIKKDELEFDIEIGTCFSRCRDCSSLVSRYREHLDGNIIENKGSCSFKGFEKGFCYEDYFE